MLAQKSFENSCDSCKNIFNTAKMIRKEILAEKNWEFKAISFDIPNSSATLLNWIIMGPKSKIALGSTRRRRNIFLKTITVL